MKSRRGSKAKKRKAAPARGKAHVHSTFNNTIVTLTDPAGNVVKTSSAGREEKGARKGTAHAAEEVGKYVGAIVKEMGMQEIDVYLKGPGGGREAAVRGLAVAGLSVLSITENTGQPHNGCRRRKRKRC